MLHINTDLKKNNDRILNVQIGILKIYNRLTAPPFTQCVCVCHSVSVSFPTACLAVVVFVRRRDIRMFEPNKWGGGEWGGEVLDLTHRTADIFMEDLFFFFQGHRVCLDPAAILCLFSYQGYRGAGSPLRFFNGMKISHKHQCSIMLFCLGLFVLFLQFHLLSNRCELYKCCFITTTHLVLVTLSFSELPLPQWVQGCCCCS